MTDAVTIVPGRIDGKAAAPASKSVTHRAFLLAAQAADGCVVGSPLYCEDTNATLRCLQALGARLEIDQANVRFTPAPLRPASAALDCANSGTTLRFMTATAARLPVATVLTGDASLRRRPNDALVRALTALGASCTSHDGRAPITVRGPLRPGIVAVDGSGGSQAASALMLALPFLDGPSHLSVTGASASRPYLDITCAAMREAGLSIQRGPAGAADFRVAGGKRVTARRLAVEGDWSSAAFLLAAAAITGGNVTVTGLSNASPQGDKRIVALLEAFGAGSTSTATSASCSAHGLVSPGTIDVASTPDLFPVLCVLATAARGTTDLVGGAHLRFKESDRIAAMASELGRMGAKVRELPDGVRITGTPGALQGAALLSHGDHRIHMALCVAALAAAGASRIHGAELAAVSFPGFHDVLSQLGARLETPRSVLA